MTRPGFTEHETSRAVLRLFFTDAGANRSDFATSGPRITFEPQARTRGQLLALWELDGKPPRTLEYWLTRLVKKGYLTRDRRGEYRVSTGYLGSSKKAVTISVLEDLISSAVFLSDNVVLLAESQNQNAGPLSTLYQLDTDFFAALLSRHLEVCIKARLAEDVVSRLKPMWRKVKSEELKKWLVFEICSMIRGSGVISAPMQRRNLEAKTAANMALSGEEIAEAVRQDTNRIALLKRKLSGNEPGKKDKNHAARGPGRLDLEVYMEPFFRMLENEKEKTQIALEEAFVFFIDGFRRQYFSVSNLAAAQTFPFLIPWKLGGPGEEASMGALFDERRVLTGLKGRLDLGSFQPENVTCGIPRDWLSEMDTGAEHMIDGGSTYLMDRRNLQTVLYVFTELFGIDRPQLVRLLREFSLFHINYLLFQLGERYGLEPGPRWFEGV